MMEANIYKPEHTLVIDYDADTNHSSICKFIQENPEIDTFVCSSSNICYEVLGEIKRLGAKNHIKNVCTFDNNKWFDYVEFPVDAITQPITDIAITAIELLKTKIISPQPAGNRKKILLNCSVEGRSESFIHGGPSSIPVL